MHLICSKVAEDEKEEVLHVAPVTSAPSAEAALPAGGLLVGWLCKWGAQKWNGQLVGRFERLLK